MESDTATRSPPAAGGAPAPPVEGPSRAKRALSLRTRIVLLIVALLIIVQGAALFMVTRTSGDIARSTAFDALQRGERIFQRLLVQNHAQLTQGASVLAADFGFRAAVATNDLSTIDDVLRNHGTRINAQVMMLLSPNLRVLVDTLGNQGKGGPTSTAFSQVFATLRDGRETSAIVVLNGDLYQLVMVPIRAPDLVAWVVMGFEVNDKAATELKSVAGMDVTFASKPAGSPWRLHASTLAGDAKTSLAATLNATDTLKTPESSEIVLGDEAWELRRSVLGLMDNTTVAVFLQRPLADGLRPFARLNRAFLWLALAGLLLGVVGSFFIARRIARPIRDLGDAARRIEQGDYDTAVKSGQKDEIGALAASLDHMREGIAHREKEILRLAYEDGLTSLPNRTMFMERLNQAIKLARRDGPNPVVMLLDLDRFKVINDTLGHHVGDLALREAGKRIAACLREADSVARLGGDEFAVLLTSAGPDFAQVAARRIIAALEQPIIIDNQSMDASGSIGIARFPDHGLDASELMRAADVAMYAAKRGKFGYTEYDPSQDSERQSHLTLLGELRRAVDRNELRLMYQPKLTLADGRIGAVEALIRWNHPVRGLVSPIDFIPFAEQTGYITQITRWVVREAVRQCGLWLRNGMEVRISINASTRDLQVREDLPGLLRETMAEHDVPGHLICVEITEGALMDDPAGARKILKSLHDMGVSLSIDDYGTGYSSLAYLKELTVNELKIDRSFVVGMHNDPQSLAIVRSTVELGHNLGLMVVAEGVESQADIDMLRSVGCDAVQGYGIARPLDPGRIPEQIGTRDI